MYIRLAGGCCCLSIPLHLQGPVWLLGMLVSNVTLIRIFLALTLLLGSVAQMFFHPGTFFEGPVWLLGMLVKIATLICLFLALTLLLGSVAPVHAGRKRMGSLVRLEHMHALYCSSILAAA